MRIVSFNIAHDSSVCSYNDGTIEFFCKEERLTRKKRDKFPFKSLIQLKDFLGDEKIDRFLYHIPENNEQYTEYIFSTFVEKIFKCKLENYSSLNHHLCHASVAFYNSGFEKSLIVVVDRNGSAFFDSGNKLARESESIFIADYDTGITPVYKSFWSEIKYQNNKTHIHKLIAPHFPNAEIKIHGTCGIVKVYEAATTLIGQHVLENGKTMGLSSYGEDLEYESLFRNDSAVADEFSHINFPINGELDTTCFSGYEDLIQNNITENNYQLYANKAKQVQIQTQEQVNNLIQKYVDITGIRNICISGGYGLNIVANSFYIKNNPDINFYFEPLSDDTGVPLGASMLEYHKLTHDKKVKYLDNNCFHFYENKIHGGGKKASICDLVNLLCSGNSVSIFDGNPESGPRALGHRSILFDARNKDAKEIVNRIKKREWYRPFAGIILKEYFDEYFYTMNLLDSPYMVLNFDAKDKAVSLVPGIIHVDNTCRIQTVDSANMFLYKLLQTFYDNTGCPILLNTSFNLAGDPLVQTKQEAIDVLYNSELDYVYFVDEEKLHEK